MTFRLVLLVRYACVSIFGNCQVNWTVKKLRKLWTCHGLESPLADEMSEGALPTTHLPVLVPKHLGCAATASAERAETCHGTGAGPARVGTSAGLNSSPTDETSEGLLPTTHLPVLMPKHLGCAAQPVV